MAALWHLVFFDRREVAADSPESFFEALRQGEPNAPADIGRYLDLLRSRGAIGFGVDLDVGPPGAAIGDRCVRALLSLMNHGWVRPSSRHGRLHEAAPAEACTADSRTQPSGRC